MNAPDNPPLFHFGLITLFPEIFNALHYGVTGRAISNGLIQLSLLNLKHFSENPQLRIDDRPYGGGPGMIMRYFPLQNAILKAKETLGSDTRVIYLSPQGQILNQSIFKQLSQEKKLILLSGRYDGIDERVITRHVDAEYSLGDFILSGGEFAALSLIDGLIRLLPGVLGNPESPDCDSFGNGLLQYPQYTRPECIEEDRVPSVLLTGNHLEILKWRKQQALIRTWQKRPDLLEPLHLTSEDEKLLKYLTEKSN